MMIPSELYSPSLWGQEAKGFKIELPAMYEGDVIHLEVTIPWYGEIDGEFEVLSISHHYDGRRGYTQKIEVAPVGGL